MKQEDNTYKYSDVTSNRGIENANTKANEAATSASESASSASNAAASANSASTSASNAASSAQEAAASASAAEARAKYMYWNSSTGLIISPIQITGTGTPSTSVLETLKGNVRLTNSALDIYYNNDKLVSYGSATTFYKYGTEIPAATLDYNGLSFTSGNINIGDQFIVDNVGNLDASYIQVQNGYFIYGSSSSAFGSNVNIDPYMCIYSSNHLYDNTSLVQSISFGFNGSSSYKPVKSGNCNDLTTTGNYLVYPNVSNVPNTNGKWKFKVATVSNTIYQWAILIGDTSSKYTKSRTRAKSGGSWSAWSSNSNQAVDAESFIIDSKDPWIQITKRINKDTSSSDYNKITSSDTLLRSDSFSSDAKTIDFYNATEVNFEKATTVNVANISSLKISGSTGFSCVSQWLVNNDKSGVRVENGETPSIIPIKKASGSDSTITLGSNGNKFKELYASKSTINTSDRNLKTDFCEFTQNHELAYMELKPLRYKFKNI